MTAGRIGKEGLNHSSFWARVTVEADIPSIKIGNMREKTGKESKRMRLF